MIMLPILSRVAIDGVVTGLGVAATAANLHMDKSVSFGVETVTKNSGTKAIMDKINPIRKGP